MKISNIIILNTLYLLSHIIIWLIISRLNYQFFISIFNNWDAGIYALISKQLYTPNFINSTPNHIFAFFPFWPVFVRIVVNLFYHGLNETLYSLIGAVLSTVIFITFLFYVYSSHYLPKEMRPKTWIGLFMIIFSPASYIQTTQNHCFY